MKKRKHTPARQYQYTLIHEMSASPSQPMPAKNRAHQIDRMRHALKNIESGSRPEPNDWRICSDAVNFMETMTLHNSGHWLDCDGEVVQVLDESGLLHDAIRGMALAGARSMEGSQIRLDGPGMQAVRAVIDDYEAMVEALPHRTMVKVHRVTERRVIELLSGKKRLPHDVLVVAV